MPFATVEHTARGFLVAPPEKAANAIVGQCKQMAAAPEPALTISRHVREISWIAVVVRVTQWEPCAPLLEVKRHPRRDTLIANVASPLRVHRPGLWSRLAADDHPVDAPLVTDAGAVTLTTFNDVRLIIGVLIDANPARQTRQPIER